MREVTEDWIQQEKLEGEAEFSLVLNKRKRRRKRRKGKCEQDMQLGVSTGQQLGGRRKGPG